MAMREVAVMAMTHMRSGICMAGLLTEGAGKSGWVRPVKERDSLRLGDMTDAAGRVVEMYDIVTLELSKARPDPPHVEDWLADLIYHRPVVTGRLEGTARTQFLQSHLDDAPHQVLIDHSRSLCLVQPTDLWALFVRGIPSQQYQARLGFTLTGISAETADSRGIPVTDLRWRALGRQWLGESGTELRLTGTQLRERAGVETFFLALGLSRTFEGGHWPMVVGVHTVPDYNVTINYRTP